MLLISGRHLRPSNIARSEECSRNGNALRLAFFENGFGRLFVIAERGNDGMSCTVLAPRECVAALKEEKLIRTQFRNIRGEFTYDLLVKKVLEVHALRRPLESTLSRRKTILETRWQGGKLRSNSD
jgi:hypothetical protein